MNWPAPGVDDVVAVSVRSRLVPSGSVKVNLTVSPGFGLVGPRSTVEHGRRAGRAGHGRAGDVAGRADKLEAERRPASSVERRRGGRRRDAQPAEPAGAEIGLPALVDDLLEAGLQCRRR